MNLRQEFDYFLANQAELVRNYQGKYLVIHGQSVWRAFDDEIAALAAGRAEFGLGNFLVQKADPGEDAYTETFYSRVAFGS
jgi:hypothetical protein